MTFPLQDLPLDFPAPLGQPAPSMARPNLYEDPEFRRVAGPTLRPGGLALTARGLDACDLRQGALVLDIGCGTGASAALARSRGLRAVGLDASEALLREARGEHPGLLFMGGAAEGLPLRDNLCDAVLCECVLSLSGEPDHAVAEFRRVLKPGGSLILTDIFLRQPPSKGATIPTTLPRTLTGTGMKSCIEGAVSRAAITARLMRQGFDILLFEDHSRLLADLAVSESKTSSTHYKSNSM